METGETSASGEVVPKQNKQKPVHPDMAQDPQERKRVLNVLAQRRYRRRKKEQQAQLENFLKAIVPANSLETSSNDSQQSNRSTSPQDWSIAQSGSQNDHCFILSDPLATISSNQQTSSSPESNEHPYPNQSIENSPTDPMFSAFINYSPNHTTNSSELSTEFGSDNGVSLHDDWQSVPTTDLALQFSNFLQNDDIQNTTFADDYLVAVPELDLLRAARTIAMRLHCTSRLWDPNAKSIFHAPEPGFDWSKLPVNLQPTSAQLSLPHHPILDLLPWPRVRTKLITMYSLPSDSWPQHPEDQTQMTPYRLVCDMEDGGILIRGDDPTSENAWEVQQRFVNAWWWALDQNVICISNLKKKARGEENQVGMNLLGS